jgi:hypothetical protein
MNWAAQERVQKTVCPEGICLVNGDHHNTFMVVTDGEIMHRDLEAGVALEFIRVFYDLGHRGEIIVS